MSKIRPVAVEFKLPMNKIIPFSVIQKDVALLSAEEPDYGYASDIAFLDLYANEVGAIHIPVITYSDLKNFKQWEDEFTKLKASVALWKDGVRPQISSMPEILDSRTKLIESALESASDWAGMIISNLKKGKDVEEEESNFLADIAKLVDFSQQAVTRMGEFQDLLTDHSRRLCAEGQQFVTLSNQVTEMTEEQQKQLDDLKKKINEYESSRKAAIAGACVTGILGGVAIVGGIAAIVLLPGVGVSIGIACFFGGAVSLAGMAICIDQAVALKKQIDAAKDEQTKIENEKMAIGIIGGQFETFASQTEDLTAAVDDIWRNWQGVFTALSNIKNYAEQISQKPVETTLADWEAIQNDLSSINAIVVTLKEAINTMQTKTNLYVDCDLDNCKTQEEIIAKLKKYWEEQTQKQTTA